MQLRVSLETLRSGGLNFEDAWELAWRQIIWPHDTIHRRQWKDTLRDTQPEWSACYNATPTTAYGDISALAAALLPAEALTGDVAGFVAA